MSYFIYLDSCGELTEEMKQSGHFANVPLTLYVGDETIVDDETFDQKRFLKLVAECPEAPKSACPAPGSYQEAFEKDVDHVYAVTLSAELSGSYNSAQLGRNLALEDEPDKKIYVFNSRSASIGETLIGMKIQECEEAGMSFEEVIETVEKYIDSQTTWFVLESLETLRKNGRLSNLKAKVASVLNIKPVMMSTPEGSITQLSQQRGMNRALLHMVENIVEVNEGNEDRIVAVSHCNCPDRGKMVAEAIASRMKTRKVIVVDTQGVSSMYASDGGIIVVC